jgi:hypothetical protein
MTPGTIIKNHLIETDVPTFEAAGSVFVVRGLGAATTGIFFGTGIDNSSGKTSGINYKKIPLKMGRFLFHSMDCNARNCLFCREVTILPVVSVSSSIKLNNPVSMVAILHAGFQLSG